MPIANIVQAPGSGTVAGRRLNDSAVERLRPTNRVRDLDVCSHHHALRAADIVSLGQKTRFNFLSPAWRR